VLLLVNFLGVKNNLNRSFFKKDTQMTKKNMKICLTALIIWEMKIKTTIRYHFISTRMSKVRRSSRKCGKEMEKLAHSHTFSRYIKWSRWFGKQQNRSSNDEA
jgi:PIN domain nuclease of toxin-antitoxin system